MNALDPCDRLPVRASARSGPLAGLIALVLLGCSSLAPGQESGGGAAWGPAFGERSLYILHLPLLHFSPADTAPLGAGQTEWALESAYANTFSRTWHAATVHRNDNHLSGQPFQRFEAEDIHNRFPQDTVLFVDGEVLRTALTGRVGVFPALSVGVEVPYVSYGAFTADSFIRGFHRAFGFDQAARDDFPDGRFVLMLQEPYGPMQFDDRRPASGVGDVVTTFSWRPAARPGGFSLGADLAVKAPSGSAEDFRGSGGWDEGLRLYGAKYTEKWAWSLEVGEVFPGNWKTPVFLSTKPFARLFLSGARRLSRTTRIGASLTFEQSPFRGGYGDLTRPGGEIALGAEHDFGPRWNARLTVTEHMPSLGDRADVGLALRIVRR